MTADIRTAGAASHAAEGWHTINWKSAYRIVCRLQARIVKAIQEGRWGKVKALQYLLTHSFSGKALAIRRVTENQGKGTPGVDREVWDTPEKKATALQALRQRGYNPQPLRNSHGISSRSRSLILARERLYSSIWEGSCRTRSSWPS